MNKKISLMHVLILMLIMIFSYNTYTVNKYYDKVDSIEYKYDTILNRQQITGDQIIGQNKLNERILKVLEQLLENK